MSQARLTLRPPPNVEFVVGYPGIPAGHDRPHAEVRGTLELRLGAQGTKAKWVRVELKKLETLPGGGQANAFYDFVGQSPVKVWEASGEWSVLHNQDFPFAIRIPESIPPTIALEKGAGIKYELTASLCTKGKKSFFFKKQDAVLTTSHPIIIDKHELHSTWPVYAQPESRSVVDELLILTVDRTHTCYGPGDRVKIVATFRNDGIPAAALRALEFLLKETIIYRAGPHATGKKGAPQVHVTPIGEQKVPVNLTIYQGQQHRAEMGCFIPQTHTTTTVGAARHIDIAYSINVKAILATGKPLLMELPVTVSNWPRNMSIEAIRRIGHAPNLSLAPPTANQQHAQGAASRPSAPQVGASQSANYNTAPSRTGQLQVHPHQINERVAVHPGAAATMNGIGSTQYTGARSKGYDDFGYATSGNASTAQGSRPGTANQVDELAEPPRRPFVQTNPTRRLTITNAELTPEEAPQPVKNTSPPKKFLSAFEEKKLLQSSMSDSAGGSGSSNNVPAVASAPARAQQSQPQRTAWASAEEEKRRLYENARQQAQKTQATMGTYSSQPGDAPSVASTESINERAPPMPVPQPAPAPKKSTPWPTAEEEKLRLFNEAQNAARRVQTQDVADGPVGGSSTAYASSPPASQTRFAGGSQEPRSTGAQIYQHAMASVNRPAQGQMPVASAAGRPHSAGGSSGPTNRYPTAEEEKAALRYYNAKRAVDRAQNSVPASPPASIHAEEPIAYDALYPTGPSQNGARSSHVGTDSTHRMSNRSDASLPPQAVPPSPPQWSNQNTAIMSALTEKERLRQKYEAEDAAAAVGAAASRPVAGPAPTSPPLYNMPPSSPRNQLPPPADFPSDRPLTAAEEKARLRAQMEAEDRAAQQQQQPAPRLNGHANSYTASSMSGQGPTRTPSLSRALPQAGSLPVRGPSLSYASRSGSLSYASSRTVPEESPDFRAPPPPPPLAPRPPVEYIQETQQEDARSQAEDHILTGASATLAPPGQPEANGDGSRVDFGLPFRPFSPFHVGINLDRSNGGTPPLPPPLPPKVPV